MSEHPLLRGLNPDQARAVQQLEGPLLILAGAGSGKTRVLTRRIAYLLDTRPDVAAWNVLAVTFTNKAAAEMKERLHQLVGDSSKKLWLGTFHSICLRILRQDIEPLGFTRDFAIWDDDDQLRVLKEILKDRSIGANPKEHSPQNLRGAIDRAKNERRTQELVHLPPSDPTPKVYKAYEQRLRAANALDFNDIIGRVIELWEQSPEILVKWQRRFQYMMVDEYQDTNPAQFQWLRLLVGDGVDAYGHPRAQNLAVVGDDDQSIYSFRGADIRNILDFEKVFPDATVVKLEQNYRSTGIILKAASGVVRLNRDRKDKTLWTSEPGGEPLRLIQGTDEQDEAGKVVGEIRRQLRNHRPSDFAIIFRTNSYSRPFEQALAAAQIPYVLVGGRRFYERREVRDIMSYIKLVLNPADDMAFQRIVNVPARGIGEKTLEGLKEEAARLGVPYREAAKQLGMAKGKIGNAFATLDLLLQRLDIAARSMPPSALVVYVAKETGYQEELESENSEEAKGRLENLEELARSAEDLSQQEPLEALREFIDRASLSGQADELPDAEGGSVTLLTAHVAKGLEFPVVFVAGLVRGLFPHSRAEGEREKEEERRLFYVALTRARERLSISWPARRRYPEGGWGDTEISQFVREIPVDAFSEQDRLWLPRSPTSRPPAPPAWSAPSWLSRKGAEPAPPRPTAPAWLAARPSAPVPRLSTAPVVHTSRADVLEEEEDARGDLRTMVPDSPESFRVGMRVLHPLLGIGTISKKEGTLQNLKLVINFPKHGPRTIYAIAAKLEIVL